MTWPPILERSLRLGRMPRRRTQAAVGRPGRAVQRGVRVPAGPDAGGRGEAGKLHLRHSGQRAHEPADMGYFRQEHVAPPGTRRVLEPPPPDKCRLPAPAR